MEILTKWVRFYVIFPKAVFFVWGLILAHSWVEYAVVALLINQLAQILPLPKAASVVNLLDGTTAVLMLVNAYFSETYLGPFLSLFCTTIAYISGFLLLYFGEGRLISIRTKILYATVILIALGRAGREIQLKEFLTDQCRTEGLGEAEEQVESRRKIWWRSAYFLGIIASVYLFTKASWKALCMISAISMGIAFAIFLLGSAFYNRKKPARSVLHNMLLALYVAITNKHPLRRYHRVNIRTLRVFNRWLDPAAVENQTGERGYPQDYEMDSRTSRLEELKSLLTMFPLWLTFLVYGLLLATGNTFFYQQTNYTANYLGPISAFSDEHLNDSCNDVWISHEVPMITFVIIRYSMLFAVSRLCDLLLWLRWGESIPRRIMVVQSGVGLTVSSVCCLVAWKIEEYRVHQRIHHAICIRFSWLIPQFVLLVLMEGLVLKAMENIFVSVVPQSLRRYGPTFTLFALNIGHFISLFFVFVFRNLFKDDLDFSRLGVYYKNLGYVCLVNLVIYCCVAMLYVKQESFNGEEVMEQPLDQMNSLQEEERPESGGVGAGDQ